MSGRNESGYHVALVGASTLKGKEIKEVLQERQFPLSRLEMLDADEVGGQLTEFDDEPAIIQPVSRDSFEGIDLAFFASSPAFTEKHWQLAEANDAQIIDLSYFLESNPKAILRSPMIEHLWTNDEDDSHAQLRDSRILVAAHPAAIATVAILLNLSVHFDVKRMAITIYEPVSEHGKAGVDELHQQTVNFLSFQKVPRQVFHSQVAFNLQAGCGDDRRPALREVEQRIHRHVEIVLGGRARRPALRVLQAPIFYGYALSCFVELKDSIPTAAIEEALDREPLAICQDPEAQPTVVDVAGSDHIVLGSVKSDPACDTGYWIWGVLDNLRLTAHNAVQIAEELVHAHEKGPGKLDERPNRESELRTERSE